MGLAKHELVGGLSLLDDRIVGLWISIGQSIVGLWISVGQMIVRLRIIVWSEDCDLLGCRLVREL